MHRERGTAVGRSPRGVAASIPEPLLTRRLDVDVFDIAILGAGCAVTWGMREHNPLPPLLADYRSPDGQRRTGLSEIA